MNFRTLALLLAALVLAGFWLFGSGDDRRSGLGGIPSPLQGGEVVELESEEAGGAISPVAEWLYVQTVGDEGPARVEAYGRALEEAVALRQRTSSEAPGLAGVEWEPAGPPKGGRVTDIAASHTEPGTAYAATAAGGVWRSRDSGLTWERSWPADARQAVGALAAGADGTLYAGTGDPVPTRGYAVSSGSGILRSTDGGETWLPSGLESSGSFGRIVVDPSDPDRVFAAAVGNLMTPGGERGLYRSTDGGASWKLVLPGETPSTGAVDVAMSPLEPRNVIAAMWERDGKRLAGSGSGVHVSDDGGDTWEEVTLPRSGARLGRIGVAFAPTDPDRAYAMAASDEEGRAVGFWRSEDAGHSWRRTSALSDSLGQSLFGWWFGRLWVDPEDAARVYVAGQALSVSTDGGESFEPMTTTTGGPPASNFHAMAWDPNEPGLVYAGADPGVLRSFSSGAPRSWVPASSQGWSQLFSPSGPSWTTIDAALAKGVEGPPPGPYGTTTTVAESRSDPETTYMGTAEGRLWRSDDAGQTWDRLEDGDGSDDLPGTWVTRVAVHPGDVDVAFAVFADDSPVQASMTLVATRDGGSTWRDVTADLPAAPINDVIALDEGRIAVATDVGVFVSAEGSWLAVGVEFPIVPVPDIRFSRETRTLTAATFGHGIQRVILP